MLWLSGCKFLIEEKYVNIKQQKWTVSRWIIVSKQCSKKNPLHFASIFLSRVFLHVKELSLVAELKQNNVITPFVYFHLTSKSYLEITKKKSLSVVISL